MTVWGIFGIAFVNFWLWNVANTLIKRVTRRIPIYTLSTTHLQPPSAFCFISSSNHHYLHYTKCACMHTHTLYVCFILEYMKENLKHIPSSLITFVLISKDLNQDIFASTKMKNLLWSYNIQNIWIVSKCLKMSFSRKFEGNRN